MIETIIIEVLNDSNTELREKNLILTDIVCQCIMELDKLKQSNKKLKQSIYKHIRSVDKLQNELGDNLFELEKCEDQ